MLVSMLTTSDNPFDPFTDFNRWFAYDVSNGYNSCAYLDRICKNSIDLSPSDYQTRINEAIDEIVALNIGGIYKKVTKQIA